MHSCPLSDMIESLEFTCFAIKKKKINEYTYQYPIYQKTKTNKKKNKDGSKYSVTVHALIDFVLYIHECPVSLNKTQEELRLELKYSEL